MTFYIAGVDEAGRGPIAGPLVVSSVILKNTNIHPLLNDSKKLSERKREILYDWIIENSFSYSIKIISAKIVDDINILQATLYGMKSSVESLKVIPDFVLIDGNKIPKNLVNPARAIVKGDSSYACIAAASILAKVSRDRLMHNIHQQYPYYAFDEHKGYPTEKHIKLLTQHGISPEHRITYKPVKELIKS